MKFKRGWQVLYDICWVSVVAISIMGVMGEGCTPPIPAAVPVVESDWLSISVVPTSCRGLKTISGPRVHVETMVSEWCAQP